MPSHRDWQQGQIRVASRNQAQLLGEILTELRVLRELALVAIRFPDLTEEERRHVVARVVETIKEQYGDDA